MLFFCLGKIVGNCWNFGKTLKRLNKSKNTEKILKIRKSGFQRPNHFSNYARRLLLWV